MLNTHIYIHSWFGFKCLPWTPGSGCIWTKCFKIRKSECHLSYYSALFFCLKWHYKASWNVQPRRGQGNQSDTSAWEEDNIACIRMSVHRTIPLSLFSSQQGFKNYWKEKQVQPNLKEDRCCIMYAWVFLPDWDAFPSRVLTHFQFASWSFSFHLTCSHKGTQLERDRHCHGLSSNSECPGFYEF